MTLQDVSSMVSSYNAMDLDALSSARLAPDAASRISESQPFTLDAWIRFNGLAARTTVLEQEGVFWFGSQGSLIGFHFAGGPVIVSDPAQPSLKDGRWHYLCVTFDGSMVRLYLDGQFNSGESAMPTRAPSPNPVVIGRALQGFVRQVRVYNTVLEAEAVQRAMFGPPPEGTVLVDLDFTVNPPIDRGAAAHAITLENNARLIQVTPAVSLRAGGFVRPMGEPLPNPGGARIDPYTVQAWVFVTAAPDEPHAIFVNSDPDLQTGMGLCVQEEPGTDRVKVLSRRGSGGEDWQRLLSTASLPMKRWINVATTFDGTTLRVYLNGVLDSAKACPPLPLSQPRGELLIGAGSVSADALAPRTFQGFVREVDVWKRALSADQIQAAMAASPEPDAEGLAAAYVFVHGFVGDFFQGAPVALAEGALLSGQVSPAPVTPPMPPRLAREDSVPLDAGLEAGLMASLRAGLDFSDLERTHGAILDDSMARDIAMFTDPDDRALVENAWRKARRTLAEDPAGLGLLITRHEINEERLLVAHGPTESTVVFRASIHAIDDCTLWRINVLLILVVGFIDAVTGLGARSTPKAVTLLGEAVKESSVAGAMGAMGTGLTAAGVIHVGAALYKTGYLRRLLVALLEVGVWMIVRLVVQIVACLSGVASARLVATLAATVAALVVAWLARPEKCKPLPSVTLTSLAFDFNPAGIPSNALPIRENFATPLPVPEWIPGRIQPTEAPCAYALSVVSDRTPWIRATVTLSRATPRTVKIRAVGGGLLGSIDPTPLIFAGTTAVVYLPLTHHTLAAGGVRRQDVEWTWYYQIDTEMWVECATTRHRVYVTLDLPTQPWQQTGGRANPQLPWVRVLDHACDWASGATTREQVLEAVTVRVNAGLGLVYDTQNGAPAYTTSGFWGLGQFLCTDFLDFLATRGGRGRVVNCTDCATIVTTFANILGTNVCAAIMGSGTGFECNQILALGTETWKKPFMDSSTGSGGVFRFHEVAWTGTCSYADPLYDACLRYDTGNYPWETTPHTAGLPAGVPFSVFGPGPSPFVPLAAALTRTTYRERLAANTARGIPACVPQGSQDNTNSGRRPVV
ncbi:LamG domain-containing protein [Pararhodospirillum oryzae]|uniref:LamG-like jellyroll fold domain-containing protein n=1 Tax=Pararhodospirillum oryzae TaxID=478448 RepID=A0A512HBF7_9PROT|nr:LamG domain-containing protein [Pararhodospirillum oryzae]GEO82781.1 hypothetical protein ROR02_29120 [Pararhodospirillum oryzae]